MENPIEMDDLGVPLFSETPTWLHEQQGNGVEQKLPITSISIWVLDTQVVAEM